MLETVRGFRAGPEVSCLAGLLLFPVLAPTPWHGLGFVALQYAILALGLNMVVGWTGLLDLGAAGFVAVGAYTTAIVLTEFGWPSLAVLPTTLLAGFVAGIVLGLPTLRHRMDYFAILTLGFAELIALGIRNWPAVTRGSYGFSGIPATRLPFLPGPLPAVPPTGYYLLALAVLIPSYGFAVWIRGTRAGRYFHIIKHSEVVARTYGINVLWIKLFAFGCSAGLLALGGFFWATYQRSIGWTEFGVTLSCLLLAALVVGGLGNPRGAILGGILTGVAMELIRRFLTASGLPQNIRYLLFAAGLVAFVHLRPNGLLPDHPRWFPSRGPPNRPTRWSAREQHVVAASAAPILTAQSLVKCFGGIVALDGVNLSVRVGESVGVIGPNGAGKTTLLNCLSGFLRPEHGRVFLDGERVDRKAAHQIARAGIGRSFQDLSVFDDVTVGNNVLLPAAWATDAEVRGTLARFGLADSGQPTALCSYGEKKSLDLARLLLDPKRWRILLLDEPTAGLTQREAHALAKVLVRVQTEAMLALVIVSHDIVFLEALGVGRLVVMERGRVFKEGEYLTIRNDPEVRRLFWGESVVYEPPDT